MISCILIPGVRAADPLIANFSPNCGGIPDASGGILVTFTDTSTGIIDNYEWNFGDGNTSAEQNPSNIFPAEGTYTITHTVRNSTSLAWDTLTRDFATTCTIPLTVDFSATPLFGVQPFDVQFSDATTSTDQANNTHLWTFGDGTISTDTNPPHTYAASGVYTINLTVTEPGGNSATLSKPYYIHVGETADTTDFSGTPKCGISPLPVQFIDQSTIAHDQWEWNFGDGGTSNLSDPFYIYNGEGSWTVSMYISNLSGGPQSIISKTDYIRVIPRGIALFSARNVSDADALIIQFNDTSTGFIAPVTYHWDFGGGDTSAEQNPVHLYTPASATYDVTLTVTGACGQMQTVTGHIIVTGGSLVIVPPSIPVYAPVADFSGMPTSGAAPLDVTFSDTSTNIPTSWSWSFGDGNSSTVRNPVHTYASPGNYTVSLTAANYLGSSTKTRTGYINLSGYLRAPPLEPVVDFYGSPTFGSFPLTVQFTDLSVGFEEPVTYHWDFGDGSASTVRNASHTYNYAGLYSVGLTVTQNDGFSESVIKNGYIDTTDIPTIELILTTDPLDSSLLSGETVIPTPSSPQGRSLLIVESGLQTRSLPMSQSVAHDAGTYQEQSLPHDISPQMDLSASDVFLVNPPTVTNWTLYPGSNFNTTLKMHIKSSTGWEVSVKDAMGLNKPSIGSMAEYGLSGYVPNGKHLKTALHVISNPPNGHDVALTNQYQTLETHILQTGEKNVFLERPVTLYQYISGTDTSLTNTQYRIEIIFEAQTLPS